jgi:hypothetical protein
MSIAVAACALAVAADDPKTVKDGALDEISGIGVGGGDYTKFLLDDTRDVGRDLARFLIRWATGQDLGKKS